MLETRYFNKNDKKPTLLHGLGSKVPTCPKYEHRGYEDVKIDVRSYKKEIKLNIKLLGRRLEWLLLKIRL